MVARNCAFVLAYFRLNLAAAMEYRVSFLAQCLGMALNDAIVFFFWWVYFDRFSQLGSWEFKDMLVLWAIVATSWGLGVTLFGNCQRLAPVIVQGQLDHFLTLPKNVLLHVLVSRMSLAGWGDVVFGIVALVIAASMGGVSVLQALLLIVLSTAVFVAFQVLVGSLAFFMGNSETASRPAQEAMTLFSTYPGPIFRGWTKILLFTAIPAGFAAHMPVELLRQFELSRFLSLLGFTLIIWAAASIVFRLGLRRYESGNLIVLRG